MFLYLPIIIIANLIIYKTIHYDMDLIDCYVVLWRWFSQRSLPFARFPFERRSNRIGLQVRRTKQSIYRYAPLKRNELTLPSLLSPLLLIFWIGNISERL